VCAADIPFDIDTFLQASKGKDAYEIQKNLNQAVKRMKDKRSKPQPIPQDKHKYLKTINDVRRYIFENSQREKTWTEAGRADFPEELLKCKTYPEICQWIRQWRDKIWQQNLETRGIEIHKCKDCGLHVNKNDHKCFVTKSKQVLYRGGIPYNKATQVTAQGGKIVSRTKKQMDLATAIKNYAKVRDSVPNAPTHEMAAPSDHDFKSEVEIIPPLLRNQSSDDSMQANQVVGRNLPMWPPNPLLAKMADTTVIIDPTSSVTSQRCLLHPCPRYQADEFPMIPARLNTKSRIAVSRAPSVNSSSSVPGDLSTN
jgi:hypothetical protein